ncbi:MAG TPA: hypothetical protein DHW02_18865 [Ktedonobacter sp.]|nr:hypothetical protein [Ktedonobacter sp.]
MSQIVPPEQSHISSEHPEQEQGIKRSASAPKKRGLFARMSPRMRATLGVIVIAIAVIGAFLGPKEGGSEADNALGDPAVTPTVVVSNIVGNATFKQVVTVQGVKLTFTRVTEASNFSDDRQRGGSYTVRVYANATNMTSAPVGLLFNQIVHLTLPDGQSIAPKYISLSPNMLPKQGQVGFIDFPLSSTVPLSSVSLHIGNETIPLS